jgi:hypothetical protein
MHVQQHGPSFARLQERKAPRPGDERPIRFIHHNGDPAVVVAGFPNSEVMSVRVGHSAFCPARPSRDLRLAGAGCP